MSARRFDWWMATAIALYVVNLVGWFGYFIFKILETTHAS